MDKNFKTHITYFPTLFEPECFVFMVKDEKNNIFVKKYFIDSINKYPGRLDGFFEKVTPGDHVSDVDDKFEERIYSIKNVGVRDHFLRCFYNAKKDFSLFMHAQSGGMK